MITHGECPQALKEEKDEFALMRKNKVGNESTSIVKSILEEFHHVDLEVIKPCLPLMGDIQQQDLKVTLEHLKSDFDSKSSKREENILLQEEVNKECALDVVSEIEKPLSKQSIFDELSFKINI